ncbi:TLC domain-containing protein 1 [Latimeria chalumnae]|uniref:TLC domain containing 1 n=1 Tax=Latimeria chalumnae TaxID=7897 RepID=M3XJ99_LATCH|nr:PREDICTED: calfacilitin [Latimeria chalumnae]|eukprot:XP_006002390.1 PREDICTED: calfacilitin [Latimeria chalumnae]
MTLQQYPALLVLSFALGFKAVHHIVRSYVPLPKQVEEDTVKTWRWWNLCVSLVHSIITGPWALLCVFLCPEMLIQIPSKFTSHSYFLVCVSSGYFVQDALDIILSGQSKASWEFLLHHALVICCFLYAVFTHRYIAGTVIALFVEVNSIFLHTRLLLKLARVQASRLYYTNKYANLITYVSFRLAAQFYLTWYIVKHFDILEHATFFLVTMMLMNIMMLIYFYRLIRTDFFMTSGKHVYLNGSSNEKKFVDD